MLSKLLKYKHILLWTVLLVGLLLARVWYVQTVPPQAYTPDEASILLNAQLLAETGRDEWNQSWPIVFRSFGDSKLPGYMYSVWAVGSVWKFEWFAVRVPSLIAGVFLPLAVWWLVRTLGGSKRAAWLSAVLLIFSPWTWHYGTIGYEAHVALLLWIVALAMFVRNPSRIWIDLVAGALIVVSILTYNAPLLLLPALILGIIFWRRSSPFDAGRAVGVLLLAGVISGALTFAASSQKGAISIIQDPTLQALYPAYREQFSGIFQTLLGNQWVYFGQQVVAHWVQSWSWEFLVSRGGANPWHSIPGTGHLNGFVLISLGLFLPFWIFQLWKNRATAPQESQAALLLFWLTATSLFPAVITVDAPHATRSLFFLVLLPILAGWSLAVFLEKIQTEFPRWAKNIFVTTVVLVIAWQTLLWMNPAQVRWQYFVSPRWNTHLIEALQQPEVQEAPQVFVIDPNGSLAAYVGVIDAQARQSFATDVVRSAPDTIGLVRVEKLGKYIFLFQSTDVPAGAEGVVLQPRSNTEWDIIKL